VTNPNKWCLLRGHYDYVYQFRRFLAQMRRGLTRGGECKNARRIA